MAKMKAKERPSSRCKKVSFNIVTRIIHEIFADSLNTDMT